MAIPAGFELATHSLEGCCSIQLSYGTINVFYPYQNFGTLSIKKRKNPKKASRNHKINTFDRIVKFLPPPHSANRPTRA